jgi:soluble lytic murein transglycosylase-like protein
VAHIAIATVFGLVLFGWLRAIAAGHAAPSPTSAAAAAAFQPRVKAVVVADGAALTARPRSGPRLVELVPGDIIDLAATVWPAGVGDPVRGPEAGTVPDAALAGDGDATFQRATYWARFASDGVARFGFVAAEAVALRGPAPEPLDVSGWPPESFEHPVVLAPPATWSIGWLPDSVARWSPVFEEAGNRHGVDAELLAIVTLVESGGDPGAKSASGAVGLMQLMPSTAADVAEQRGLTVDLPEALLEPTTNVDLGSAYLAEQLQRFGVADDTDWQMSVSLAAAAYNGGPGHLMAYLAGEPLATEAQSYRAWVSGMWNERHAATSDTYTQWLDAGGWRLVAAAGNDAVAQVAER